MSPPVGVTLVVIGCFVALSYYATEYQQKYDCGMLPFFSTSLTIILIFVYNLTEHCIIDVCTRLFAHTTNKSRQSRFTVDELEEQLDEQDGTPLPPDPKSGLRINTDEVSSQFALD
jgi:hypothetical protein